MNIVLFTLLGVNKCKTKMKTIKQNERKKN